MSHTLTIVTVQLEPRSQFQTSFLILCYFSGHKYFEILYLLCTDLNFVQPQMCTPPLSGLSNGTNNIVVDPTVTEIHGMITQQTKQALALMHISAQKLGYTFHSCSPGTINSMLSCAHDV